MASSSFMQYVDRYETDTLALELSFNGAKWNASRPHVEPSQTNVEASLFRRVNELESSDTWIKVWNRSFGHLRTPTAPWNGFKLAILLNNRAFLGVDNKILEIDIQSGETIWQFETGNTPIGYILISHDLSALIIFNEYYEFHHVTGHANIAAISLGGEMLWRAARPSSDDIFANHPEYFGNILTASTWNGLRCSLDERTGKILSMKFTK